MGGGEEGNPYTSPCLPVKRCNAFGEIDTLYRIYIFICIYIKKKLPIKKHPPAKKWDFHTNSTLHPSNFSCPFKRFEGKIQKKEERGERSKVGQPTTSRSFKRKTWLCSKKK